MIIVDINQIMISNLMVTIHRDNLELGEDLIRHMVLNSLRGHNKKFRKQYGEMVIACDSGNVWRRDIFPNYKAGRKANREKSEHDWEYIFDLLSKVKNEIKQFLPYKVIEVESVEADDIIAVLCKRTNEKVLILSGDKDFIQLQKYKNVKQFSPIQKKMVTDKNPRTYAFNHIMRGDGGDGVPNVLSADDTFVTDKSQTPLRQTRIDEWLQNSDRLREVMPEEIYRNYQRNKKLIDLTEIPDDIQETIINTFENQKVPMKMKVLNYLIKKRCNLLIEVAEEFYNG